MARGAWPSSAAAGPAWRRRCEATRARPRGHAVRDGAAARRPRARASTRDGLRARQRPAHPDRRLPRDAGADARRSASTPSARCCARRCALADARRPRPAAAARPAGARPSRAACCAARGWTLARPAGAAAPRPAAGRCAAFAATRRSTVAAADARACRPRVRDDLIDPLCVAALNTPADEASATVFLRVLRDALFGGPGLGRPAAAARRPGRAAARRRRGAGCSGAAPSCGCGTRVQSLARDGERLARRRRAASTRVVLACTRRRGGAPGAPHRARLGAPAPRRCATSRSSPSTCAAAARACREPMMALRSDDARARRSSSSTAAQLGGPAGPARLRDQRRAALGRARARGDAARRRCAQAQQALGAACWRGPLAALRTLVAEKRATFRCTPGLQRPPMRDRARAAGRRRLRRRPLPGHAGRRGAQRRAGRRRAGLSDSSGFRIGAESFRHAKCSGH